MGFPLSIYLLHLGVPNLQDLMPDAIIIDIKCIINVMHLNHPKTISLPRSVEKLSSIKPVPDVKKIGDRCSRGQILAVYS